MGAPESREPDGPILVRVVRDGVVESRHHATVVVADPGGRVVAALGDPELPTYVRSAAKPLQALATLELLRAAGLDLTPEGLAIACASHIGTDEQQIEAAHLLALADLDESALQTPAALPADHPTWCAQRVPSPLAHNCSGKHAAFLYAHTASGAPVETYLDPNSDLQRLVRERLSTTTGQDLTGPGIDGCGAPAWILPLRGLAIGFARLAAGVDGLARVRDAMVARPDLVGGHGCDDTAAMVTDSRVVAKRGAEGVLAAGLPVGGGHLGIAVKVGDGADRAAGPLVGAALRALGARVPDGLVARPVLGGGRPRGAVEADAGVADLVARLR